MRLTAPLCLVAAVVALAGGGLSAHEVPPRVLVQAFVKPEGDTLRVLLRVPLEALRDLSVPTRGPGYLDLEAVQPVIRDAAMLWLGDEMRFYENDRPLGTGRLSAARVSLPSSRAFAGYHRALAHLRGPPLPPDTQLYWEQGLLDVEFQYAIDDPAARFAMDLGLAHLGQRTVTVLEYLPPDGPSRVFRYQGDPGRVVLDPGWHQAAGRFLTLGFEHVLGGLDHLLFVLCLVIPFRRLKPLVMLVTAFTLAHSITLAAAALGMAPAGGWFAPFIETLIAVSIVYLALEDLLGALSGRAPRLQRRWLVAFGFGLVHGFGFAFVLGDSLQFAGTHLLASLAAFNVGIELGQLLVVAVTLAVLAAAFRAGLPERFGIGVLCVLVAHTAWHWLLQRGSAFLAHPWSWPSLSAGFWAGALRWAMLALIVVLAVWLLHLAYARWVGADPAPREL